MDIQAIQQLNSLNKEFYTQHASSFSSSRNYFWDGWKQLEPYIRELAGNTDRGYLNVLDVGCGNGRFAAWLDQLNLPLPINYHGVDLSPNLLSDAQMQKLSNVQATWEELDVVETLLTGNLELNQTSQKQFDLIVLFGVLHHIPSFALRVTLVHGLKKHLSVRGMAVISIWRFLDQPQLASKIVTDQSVLNPGQLEKNDFILDWQRGNQGLRYAHYVDEDEKIKLCQPFHVIETWLSDGPSNQGNEYVLLRNKEKVHV
jgi:tRNA (uracil-5-)-methyltransferase TRM9